MRRFLAACLIWLLAFPALAWSPTQTILAGPQVTTKQGAAVDLNFSSGGYPNSGGICATWGHYVACYKLTSNSRASSKYCNSNDGFFFQVATGLPCIGQDTGYLIEEARTNSGLWSRDMTNAAWVKVSVTAALTATGIDGTANSASQLTATGASGTVLQTITLGSSADTYSVWLKRISGTGTVNISADGLTWTAAALTTTWTRFSVSQTLANPTFGIQIVTSGDVIAVDFNQLEAGTFATSPILTTSVAATRAADVVTMNSPPAFGTAYTIFGKGTPQAPAALAQNQYLVSASDGTNNNRFSIFRNQSNSLATAVIVASGVNSGAPGNQGACTINVSSQIAMAGAPSDQAFVRNGQAATTSAVAIPAPNSIQIGVRPDSGALTQWNGYVERIAIWPTQRLPNVTLQALTQ
jgi:hypothetical protein